MFCKVYWLTVKVKKDVPDHDNEDRRAITNSKDLGSIDEHVTATVTIND